MCICRLSRRGEYDTLTAVYCLKKAYGRRLQEGLEEVIIVFIMNNSPLESGDGQELRMHLLRRSSHRGRGVLKEKPGWVDQKVQTREEGVSIRLG